jgi:hypothetical protein
MANNKNTNLESESPQPSASNRAGIIIGVVGIVAALVMAALLVNSNYKNQQQSNANKSAPNQVSTPAMITDNTNTVAQQTPPGSPTPAPANPAPGQATMDVAKAVMVTVEEDFGKNATIASAITQVERRYKADDGSGRTFAILDAYGEVMPDGKVHMSMHVSSEKPGTGQIIHKKTGKVLWDAKINPVSVPPPPKALRIIVEGAPGGSFNVDVISANNILNATASGKGMPVMNLWPDGAEMEVTFIYSMCGCPVKAKVKRMGDKTVRTNDMPVMFPDDPDALKTIAKFMKWPS